MLNHAQRAVVLQLARESIRNFLDTGKQLVYPTEDFFGQPAAVFVTLKKQDELRGCIGIIEDIYSLGEAVARCAISSAFEDPRFPALNAEEFPDLEFEVSILSEFREISNPEEVIAGTHGLHIARGLHRGLLLPQVATEHHWDRETFLRHACMKAGLPPDAWKFPDTKIRVFTAEVFGDEESH